MEFAIILLSTIVFAAGVVSVFCLLKRISPWLRILHDFNNTTHAVHEMH
jgi:hypothetical protein